MNMSQAYTAGQNNGQIASETNAISGGTVNYLYDSLKRLSSATAGSWGESFVYDGFGNLLQKNATAGSPPTIQMTVNAANNQITSAGGSSYRSDANSNMLYGPTLNNTQYSPLSYDFRNRVSSLPNGSNTMEYGYDASNRRVWKGTLSGGSITVETYYLYDLDGTQLGSYAAGDEWIESGAHDGGGAPVSGGDGGGLAHIGGVLSGDAGVGRDVRAGLSGPCWLARQVLSVRRGGIGNGERDAEIRHLLAGFRERAGLCLEQVLLQQHGQVFESGRTGAA